MKNTYELHEIKTSFLQWSNYSYIVLDNLTKRSFVVDPAWEMSKMVDKIDKINTELTAIFLTHSHYDHVNLVNPLVKRFNSDVFMSKKEIDYYKFRCRNLVDLDDREIINIGNTEITCMLTPGHTKGGMCYLLPDSIFTGDTIFAEGCGICNGDGGSANQMFESIQKLKSQVSAYVRVYPGHSYGKVLGQTIEQIISENIYFQIDEKECFVNFRMRKNQKGLFDFK